MFALIANRFVCRGLAGEAELCAERACQRGPDSWGNGQDGLWAGCRQTPEN